MFGQCSECKGTFEIQPSWVGQKAQCPYCKAMVTIQECSEPPSGKLESNGGNVKVVGVPPQANGASLGMWACYAKAFKNYGTFQGRASRREYWYFFLAHFIVSILIALLFNIIAQAGMPSLSSIILVISSIYHLATIVPFWSIGVRRLHDINTSGWFILLPLIPLVGAIWLLVYECSRGTVGPNQYGEDPYSGIQDV